MIVIDWAVNMWKSGVQLFDNLCAEAESGSDLDSWISGLAAFAMMLIMMLTGISCMIAVFLAFAWAFDWVIIAALVALLGSLALRTYQHITSQRKTPNVRD